MISLPMCYVFLRLSPLFIISIATKKKIGYFDSISDIINETPFVALRAKNIAKYSRYSFNFDFFLHLITIILNHIELKYYLENEKERERVVGWWGIVKLCAGFKKQDVLIIAGV